MAPSVRVSWQGSLSAPCGAGVEACEPCASDASWPYRREGEDECMYRAAGDCRQLGRSVSVAQGHERGAAAV